jgi:type III restriction enzyme
MSNAFFDRPILNSPYTCPTKHWELDDDGIPTLRVINERRKASYLTPIPKPKTAKKKSADPQLDYKDQSGLSTHDQDYDPTSRINEIRLLVDQWRKLPEHQWGVTPETSRLLHHWRNHTFTGVRPFFCQIEAAEVAIWLTEVAPTYPAGQRILDFLKKANDEANQGLNRLALKLATGAGKTTVMAMLIAWQTINAVRRPSSKTFTRGFLIVTPGLTIKDRLRVLLPNDSDSYYSTRELVPTDFLPDIHKAKIVITNYHAFKLRERLEIASGTRALLQGQTGPALNTLETPGLMLQRVMPDLMAIKNVMVLNDEAHHCYREKATGSDEQDLSGDDKKEAQKNNEAARLWISGLAMVKQKLGLNRIIDLSATPFFLRGSGYAEGTLFPWTMSDFSLMDAIEAGIVKVPRVPVSQNIVTTDEMPLYRDLWENIRKDMPKSGRSKGEKHDPASAIPNKLETAFQSLYGHYEKTFNLWREKKIAVPPCFIIVCQNTSISKLIYDYVSGFTQNIENGPTIVRHGKYPLFSNFNPDTDQPLPRPNTILIDSEQLEAGDALDDNFRHIAANEIECFRREIIERTGNPRAADDLTDQALLREVMNTVGKPGRLGADIRCVVSVAMLTEGWDANTVTHILGIRAFGTQLLCEQVIGRALRRQSYDLADDGLFNVEYADIFGIPFKFTAKPVIAPPQPPRQTTLVRAVTPERDSLEIRFPRVQGYRSELPQDAITAKFTDDSILTLTPDLVGPTKTRNAGIIGQDADMNLEHLDKVRPAAILFSLTEHLVNHQFRDPGQAPPLHLFGQLKRITKEWFDHYLLCKGNTYPGLLMYKDLADRACNKITAAITRQNLGITPIRAILDSFNPSGSTRHVRFNTSKDLLWSTSPLHSHVNYVVCDSGWEQLFCQVVEDHPQVRAYVKNQGLGFEVPYTVGSQKRLYLPDFILLIDDGHGPDDLLHLIIEIKGFKDEGAKIKKETMEVYWVPGVNHLGSHGRWAFAQFTDPYDLAADLDHKLKSQVDQLIRGSISCASSTVKGT